MKNIKSYYSIFTLLLSVTTGFSQAVLTGSVKNDEGESVNFATVVLLENDSTLVKAEYTNDAGAFTFKNVPFGIYRLQIRNVEYVTVLTDAIEVRKATVNLNELMMTRSTTELDEVVVEAQRPLVEIHPDKTVFNVAESINATGNDGLALIGKAPGVILDPDNNVVLAGKTGVRIFINGRPSRLSGDDLQAMLQSMQSENIESIEIMTNPSAKYEAEGNSGIINIVLKKQANLGLNGSANASFSSGTLNQMNYGTSLNYRNQKINAYGSISRFDNDIQDDFDQQITQNGFVVGQRSLGIQNNTGINSTVGVDFSLNERNILGVLVTGILNDRGIESIATSPITQVSDGAVQEILIASNRQQFETTNLNYNLNYAHTLKEGGSITLDVNYGDYGLDGTTDQPNTYFEPDGTTIRSVSDIQDIRSTDISLFAAKADFERSLGALTLSMGGKFTSIRTDNGFQFFNVVNGTSTLDEAQSNVFMYTEEVTAGYLILSGQLSEKANANAGFRVEHTESRGLLSSPTATANDDVKRSYTDFFPSLGISYKPNKNLSMNMGVGFRIQRPDYQSMNPFEYRLTELNFFSGNPFLTPQYTANYQLSFSYKQALTGSVLYSETQDFFADILDTAKTVVTFLIPRNLDESSNLSFNLGYPITLTDWWELRADLNYTYSTYNGEFEDTVIDLEAQVYTASVSNILKLPWGIRGDISYYYNSDFIWRGSIEVDAFSRVDGGIRKSFLEGKLQASLTFSDLFNNGSDYVYEGDYGGMMIDGVRSRDNRRFGVSLSYKFGNDKVKSSRKRKTGLDEEVNRMLD